RGSLDAPRCPRSTSGIHRLWENLCKAEVEAEVTDVIPRTAEAPVEASGGTQSGRPNATKAAVGWRPSCRGGGRGGNPLALEREGGTRSTGLEVVGEVLEQLALASGTDHALHRLTVLEHDQRRNAHHIEAASDVGVVVDVQLGDLDLAGMLVRHLAEDRGD